MQPRNVERDEKGAVSVTLPDDWTEEHGVASDGYVYLTEAGGGAVAVYPNASDSVYETDARLDADALEPEEIERYIVASYVLGRGRITVVSDDGLTDEQILEVYSAEKSLMGAGIVEESEDAVVVRCSVNPGEFSMPELLERLNSTAETMRAESVDALLSGDATTAKRAARRERQANKVFVLVLRLLLTAQQNPRVTESIGLETPLHVVGTRASAKALERSADYAEEAAECAQTLAQNLWKPDEETAEKLETLVEVVDEACERALECLQEGDIGASSEARTAYDEAKAIEDEITESLLENAEDTESVMLFMKMVSALSESAKEAVEIAEVASNRAVEG
ncbi:MAG: PhoU domain-containing protein [Halobacteriales archaeon]|nr:PhoU domain-containing protein [Halobacteriales archaeon]